MPARYIDRSVEVPRSPGEIAARLNEDDDWQMTDQERLGLSALLSKIRPAVAIEVGTYEGGSLDVVSRLAGHVYSLDIKPDFRDQHGDRYANVDFVVGDSKEMLPALLDELESNGDELEFVLIDGDHSEEAVRADVNAILGYEPVCPLYLVMHDSFNPSCRRGIVTAGWSDSPFVHLVEIDFVTGRLFNPEDDGQPGEMWCGFALAILLPERRQGELSVRQSASLMYEASVERSVHATQDRWRPLDLVERMGTAVARRFR